MHTPILYLHIGLPKTATTYLQHEVFPALTRIEYLGTPRSNLFHGAQDLEHGQRTLTSCVRRSSVLWDQRGDEIFRDLLGPRRTGERPGSVLLSDEGIGRACSRPLLLAAHLQGMQRHARLWGFDGVRILGSFRRQDHWLASHYAQMSDRTPGASQEDFERMVKDTLDPYRSRYGFGMLLDYETVCARIGRVVGEENLLMLPYELLRSRPSEFHRGILSFLGVDLREAGGAAGAARKHNVRSRAENSWDLRASRWSRTIRLRPERLFSALRLPREVRLIWRGRGGTIRLTEEITAAVMEAYGPSNQSLGERLGLDLDSYGYFPTR